MQIIPLLTLPQYECVLLPQWVSVPPAPHSHLLLSGVNRQLPLEQTPASPCELLLKGCRGFSSVLF